MTTQHYFLILKSSNVEPVGTWLQGHPVLDPRSGGAETFGEPLAFLSDPTDGSVVRAVAANWKLPDNWLAEIMDEYGRRNFKINVKTPNWDASVYPRDVWPNVDLILADDTLKPEAFQLVGQLDDDP